MNVDKWVVTIIFTGFLWSLGYLLLKLNVDKNDLIPTYFNMFLGQIIFFILLSIVIIFVLKKSFLENYKMNMCKNNLLAMLAGFTFTFGTLFFIYSLKYGKNMPSVRILGIVLEILIVLVLSCLFLNEKITFTNYLGIIITLIGISIIVYFK